MRNLLLSFILLTSAKAFAFYPNLVDFDNDRWDCSPAPMSQPFIFIGQKQRLYTSLVMKPVSSDGWFSFELQPKEGEKKNLYFGNVDWASGKYPTISQKCGAFPIIGRECMHIQLTNGRTNGHIRIKHLDVERYLVQLSFYNEIEDIETTQGIAQGSSAWSCQFH